MVAAHDQVLAGELMPLRTVGLMRVVGRLPAHVHARGDQFDVVWVDAPAVSAEVVALQVARDRADQVDPRPAMREHRLTMLIAEVAVPRGEA